jgi:hypothetical protein
MKESIIDGAMKLISTGAPIPEGFQPLLKLIINNEAMPLMRENEQMAQQEQEEQMQQQQQAEAEQQIMAISEQTGLPPEQIMQQMQQEQGGEPQQMVA